MKQGNPRPATPKFPCGWMLRSLGLILIATTVAMIFWPDQIIACWEIMQHELSRSPQEIGPLWTVLILLVVVPLGRFIATVLQKLSGYDRDFERSFNNELQREVRPDGAGIPTRPFPRPSRALALSFVLLSLAGLFCWILMIGNQAQSQPGNQWQGGTLAMFNTRISPYGQAPRPDYSAPILVALALIAAYTMILIPRGTTHMARRPLELGFKALFIVAALIFLIVIVRLVAGEPVSPAILFSAISIIGIWVNLAAIRAFAMPSSLISSIPLFLSVMAIPFCYVPVCIIAGLWFPTHRRLREYWKPTRLPRIPIPRGMTLIELLIVVAIAAISSVALAHVTMATHQTARRAQAWHEAVQLIEDQFALLRAQGGVPAQGPAPLLDPALQAHPLAAAARIEILPGPDPGTRAVWIRVRAGEPGQERDVAMARVMRTREIAP